ncbi:hypothetical protein [Roseovarius sp. MMSF_3350]|uniref:hypothetical protein n=1 Tax=Roseovarius sp. MMSF_3350 TaxID=3046706 RepID=UPI00273F8288|nr:hypothetical protein [Roseovarius sp. MMSF_3350]
MEFWAIAELNGDDFTIRIGDGVRPALARLWADALADTGFVDGIGTPFPTDTIDPVDVALQWLTQHEQNHFDLGHFDLLDRTAIGETARSLDFSISQRRPVLPDRLTVLEGADRTKVEPCLELQADHDATESVLGAYSKDGWPELHGRMAAIASMMMLIEREDAAYGAAISTHPKAATRIFQLLGHAMEMPLITAHLIAQENRRDAVSPDDLPSDEEQSAFNRTVIIPAYFDAVHLARIAGAESIAADLGDVQSFFADIQIAKLSNASRSPDLSTTGAQEWAELVRINDQLKAIQGL